MGADCRKNAAVRKTCVTPASSLQERLGLNSDGNKRYDALVPFI
jgi:hypothetical protein